MLVAVAIEEAGAIEAAGAVDSNAPAMQ